MKKISLLALLVCSLAFAGCNKDAEINAFVTEFEAVTKEMTQKLNDGDVDGARKAFDDKKASLQTSWNSMKDAREIQVSTEAKQKMEESVQKNVSELTAAAMSAAGKAAGDMDKAQAIQTLLKDYVGIFQM